MVTPLVTLLMQGISHSMAAGIERLDNAFVGIVLWYFYSAYNLMPIEQSQLC